MVKVGGYWQCRREGDMFFVLFVSPHMMIWRGFRAGAVHEELLSVMIQCAQVFWYC